MSIVGLLFAGKPEKHPDTGWEPFKAYNPNDPEPSEDDDGFQEVAAEWAEIIRVAKANGIKVQFKESGIHMSLGKSHGQFKDARGGLKLAKEFVRGLV
jgi:subtilisin family serine protease